MYRSIVSRWPIDPVDADTHQYDRLPIEPSCMSVPIGAQNEEIVETYDRFASPYDRLLSPLEDSSRRHAIDALGVESGDRVLEIGCGPGHALVELARRTGPAGAVIGLDAASGMIARAVGRIDGTNGRRLRDGGSDSIDWVHPILGDARTLPIRRASIDAVFIEDTLELFSVKEMEIVLEESHRVLRDGGRLGVVTMDRHGIEDEPFLRAYEWLYEHVPGSGRIGCRPVYARRAIERAGFAIERHERTRRLGVWPVDVLVGRRASDAREPN